MNKSPKTSKDRVIDLIRFVILVQMAIVAVTILGCFVAKSNKCNDADLNLISLFKLEELI